MQKLRLQLIGILIVAVLLPLVPAALATRDLFRRSLDPLLESSIADGAQAGLAVSREVLQQEKNRFIERIRDGAPVDTLTAAEIGALDKQGRSALTAAEGPAQADSSVNGLARIVIPPERMKILDREALVAVLRTPAGAPVWVAQPLPAELVPRVEQITRSIRLLETLRRERSSVLRGFEATFLVVYGVIVVLVLLAGLYLASRLTRPMAALGRGINQVAAGDLDARVSEAGGGEIGRLLKAFNGMVERLRMQQEDLVRLERIAAWRQMSRRLAHEIKNPLTPIQLAAQTARDSYSGEDPAFRSLLNESTAIIEEEVAGLRRLVTEFSQFARLPEPSMAWVAPSDLASDLVALYGDDKLVVHIDGDPGSQIWCDPEQIHRALMNLVINAHAAQEAIGCQDPVTLHIEPTHEGGARIQVEDHGPGVPESERRRIFEPDVTTKPDGMGLGLAIVESTIQSHRGTIVVMDREGGGASFVITLPPGSSTPQGGVA